MKTYTYSQIESMLKSFLFLEEADLLAFRAKLRRFRDLGIPSIEKTGSGSKAEYTVQHALELAIAFTIARYGVSPKFLANLVSFSIDALNRGVLYGVIGPEGTSMADITGDLKGYVSSVQTHMTAIVYLDRIKKEVERLLK